MNPTALRACIFCGGRPVGREHAVAGWVSEVLESMEPSGPKDWRTTYEAGGIVEQDRAYPQSRVAIVVKVVCEPCNSGWMSQQENAAKPLVEPMIRGKKTVLAQVDQLVVATWASKTAMLVEFHEPGTVVNGPADYAVLRFERRPPSHHRVRIASRRGYESALRHASLGATHKPNGTVDAFVSTLIIGHLVVQVWGGAGDGVYEPFKAVATSTADSVMIYPPASGVVAWPPPRLLEEEDLDRFIREPYAYASDSAELLEWRDRRRAAED